MADRNRRPPVKSKQDDKVVDTRFRQTGMEDDHTDPRPHNNYDDSITAYPPAQRW